MMRSSTAILAETGALRFAILIEWGTVTAEQLDGAARAARARGVELEQVLIGELGIGKQDLLAALSEYYNCPFIEYDERMPVPADLLRDVDGERLSLTGWFPVIREGDLVVIAARDPQDDRVFEEVKAAIKAGRYEFWVALDQDIQWFIQDYLHARPGSLIGTDRTRLAAWRNTMAHWRTRLACYRNDLAKGRTDLALLRWGLGLVALADVMLHTRTGSPAAYWLTWSMLSAGIALGLVGLRGYLNVRSTRMQRPGHHTLVEVTAATLQFLEQYHDLGVCTWKPETKGTMLARLGDCVGGYSTILTPTPASKERTHLARERNVLAAQRTIAATYRTIHARARTGLAFIRTGISFMGLGLGLLKLFTPGALTLFDALLIAAGLFMAVDGLLWYWPVRKEQGPVPRCG